jgi:hypothetical protein
MVTQSMLFYCESLLLCYLTLPSSLPLLPWVFTNIRFHFDQCSAFSILFDFCLPFLTNYPLKHVCFSASQHLNHTHSKPAKVLPSRTQSPISSKETGLLANGAMEPRSYNQQGGIVNPIVEFVV